MATLMHGPSRTLAYSRAGSTPATSRPFPIVPNATSPLVRLEATVSSRREVVELALGANRGFASSACCDDRNLNCQVVRS